jgi:formate hydrogenlyase transcriptional activator
MTNQLLRILLVEDNAGDARLLREKLSSDPSGSIELTHVRRLNEAVAHLAKDEVDIVLLDMGLPDAHGLDSIRRIVAAAPDVALIVLTGFEDDVLAATSIKEGAQDYLIKGQIDDLALSQVLRFAIERHQLQKEERQRAEDTMLRQFSSNVLAVHVDILKLLSATSASIQEIVQHDFAAIMLCQPDLATLRLHIVECSDKELHDCVETMIPVENSPAEATLRTRKPVLLDQLTDTPYALAAIQHLTSREVRSGCWVPLLNQGSAMGVLMVGSRREYAFTQQAATLLGQMASQIATALANAPVSQAFASPGNQEEMQDEMEADLSLDHEFEDIVGDSTELKQVLKGIETVAPTDATVLIQGETGTGKELLARAIHQLSRRHAKAFIKLNCAAIPAGLLESELFGHEKGAFTGAFAQKKGRVELAHEGTLFLDEVGELPIDLQPKLLRALQEREIERLGGTRAIAVDVRLVAATNRDLVQMVAEREFRSDLYYRLKVFPIVAPSLRQRRSDIPILVRHFVDKYSRRMAKPITNIRPEAMQALVKWAWPGNIRELENFIERAVILSRGPTLHIILAELEPAAASESDSEAATLEEAEREHILRALREAKGVIGGPGGAAERLALKRTTLNSKLKKLGIARNDYM